MRYFVIAFALAIVLIGPAQATKSDDYFLDYSSKITKSPPPRVTLSEFVGKTPYDKVRNKTIFDLIKKDFVVHFGFDKWNYVLRDFHRATEDVQLDQGADEFFVVSLLPTHNVDARAKIVLTQEGAKQPKISIMCFNIADQDLQFLGPDFTLHITRKVSWRRDVGEAKFKSCDDWGNVLEEIYGPE